MSVSTDPTVLSSARDDLHEPPHKTLGPRPYRVSSNQDPYAEAELQRRIERTRSMIEKARRQLL